MVEGLDEERGRKLLDTRLRLMLSASEPLLSDIPRTWMSQFAHPARHVHMFGQTETAGIVSLYHVPASLDDELNVLRIGLPIASSQVYILDADQRPCQGNVAGERYIGGARVGGAGRPLRALTAGHLVAHP